MIETLSLFSAAMQKEIKATVVTPGSYGTNTERLPTVYLLHGYGRDHEAWLQDMPVIRRLADRHDVILVCPDGGADSWYWDSPVDPACRYETHIVREVVPFVDRHYRTMPSREGRAIAGLSMGGQGAWYLALRHPEKFGAAGSMSGAMDVCALPEGWNLAQRLGTHAEHRANWESHSILHLVSQRHSRDLALIADCGIQDVFIGVNRRLHEELLRCEIPHDYTERFGGHDAAYWGNAVEFQLLFFRKFFDEVRTAAATAKVGAG